MQWWQFCGKVRMQVMRLFIHCTVKIFHTASYKICSIIISTWLSS